MAKLTLDDVFIIQDILATLLESNIGKEFVYQRSADGLHITFNPLVIASLSEGRSAASTPPITEKATDGGRTIGEDTPALDEDERRVQNIIKNHERHLL